MFLVSRLSLSLCHSKNIPRISSVFSKFNQKKTENKISPKIRQFSTTSGRFASPSSSPNGRRFFGAVIVGGAISGGLYAYFTNKQKLSQIQSAQEGIADSYLVSSEIPKFPPARKIVNPLDTSNLKITLFQYQTCPFCCKARAFLDFYGLNYDVIEVNSVTRKQTKWTTYKKVPILVVETPDGKVFQLNDSTLIISAMASFLFDQSQELLEVLNCYPRMRFTDNSGVSKLDVMNKYFLMYKDGPLGGRTKEQVAHERKWRKWTDDSLVHMLSPNVYRTMEESLQAFNWFDETGNWKEHFKTWERYLVIYVGACAMYFIGKRLKKRHHLKDDVRQSLYDDCNFWMKNVRLTEGLFMGGEQPNLADLAAFGALSAIEGCNAFQDLLENTQIANWYYPCKKAIEEHQGQLQLLEFKKK